MVEIVLRRVSTVNLDECEMEGFAIPGSEIEAIEIQVVHSISSSVLGRAANTRILTSYDKWN